MALQGEDDPEILVVVGSAIVVRDAAGRGRSPAISALIAAEPLNHEELAEAPRGTVDLLKLVLDHDVITELSVGHTHGVFKL